MDASVIKLQTTPYNLEALREPVLIAQSTRILVALSRWPGRCNGYIQISIQCCGAVSRSNGT